MKKILGVSGSLRNARYGAGSDAFVAELRAVSTQDELVRYLQEQTKARADDFIEAGRKDSEPFDVIYRNLLRSKGDRGLSNSEAALGAALWGASQTGVEIEHCGLSRYFPMSGDPVNLEELKARVLAADALLISGPVYFGDRGSAVQEFIEFLRQDDDIARHVRDMPYAGVAVGAKRNGGQETTLIYQMIDLINLNMLAVGNDSRTTSQYGGTAKAGDVGTLVQDDYGIDTCIGTGRRLARAVTQMASGGAFELNDKLRVGVWLLQDSDDGRGRAYIEALCADLSAVDPRVEFDLIDFTKDQINRCIACDICPTHIGPPEEYRCIIKSRDDAFVRRHGELISSDAFLFAAYSPVDRHGVNSVYQRFVERTRYLRRDDYILGDKVCAPLVISEINSNQNLHIRMMTSLVRHHEILHHPLIGMEVGNEILNLELLVQQLRSFVDASYRATVGRLAMDDDALSGRVYKPIGYEISAEKHRQDIASADFGEVLEARIEEKTRQSARISG